MRRRRTRCVSLLVAMIMLLTACGNTEVKPELTSEMVVVESSISQKEPTDAQEIIQGTENNAEGEFVEQVVEETTEERTESILQEPIVTKEPIEIQKEMPATYIDFCNSRMEESKEAKSIMIDRAREQIFYLLKAYEEMELPGYEEWASPEEIFTDEVLDKLCNGDTLAKAAVSEAVIAFQEGDSLSSSFGQGVNAAVQEIPGLVKEKFLKELLGEYLFKGINIYSSMVDSANGQATYAISLVEERVGESVNEMVFLLSEEEISAAELDRCVYLIEEACALIKETEYRFSLDIATQEWENLSLFLYSYASSYKHHDRRSNLYEKYLQVPPEEVYTFLEEFDLNEEELEQLSLEIHDYWISTFLPEHLSYLDIEGECVTLRGFDYAQMVESSKQNMIMGTLSSTFGNFLTDIFVADAVSNDTTRVYELYRFSQTCQSALAEHRSGIVGLGDILDDVEFMVMEFYNTVNMPEDSSYSLEEQLYMWFIFCDYYGGNSKPEMSRYQQEIERYCKELRAYYTLLSEYVIGAQYVFMDMNQEVNWAYIQDLMKERDMLQRSLSHFNVSGEMADISKEEDDIISNYIHVLEVLGDLDKLPADVVKTARTMNAGYSMLTYTKEDEEGGYLNVAPVLVSVSKQGEERVRFYSFNGSSICRWQNGQGDYIIYHIAALNDDRMFGIGETNMVELDNADTTWTEWDTSNYDICNDYFSYTYEMMLSIAMARRYPEEEGAFLESALEICLQMIR